MLSIGIVYDHEIAQHMCCLMKATEGHSVAVSQTKNGLEVVGFDHLSLGGSFENFLFCIFPHFPVVIKNRRNYSKRRITTYVALPCYNDSEKKLFYMRWLI